MKKAKHKRTLRAADGVILADARPVSPFSIKGIGRGLSGGYDSLVDAASHGIEAVAKPFSRPAGYTPALAPAPAPVAAPVVPVPAPAALPQLGGMNLGVIQQREAAAGLRDGGMVRGKGGPVDDQVDAKLSPGESVLPADTTAAVGPENIQRLIDETHTPAHLQKKGVPAGGRRGLRFANGIAGLDVTETPFTESDARMFGQRPAGTVPGTASMPGVSVREGMPPSMAQPSVPGVQVSYPVTDPGPGNPNVGDRVGPQRPVSAPAATPMTEARAAAPAAAAAAEGGGLAYRTGRMLATGLRAAPSMVVAGELADNLGTSKVSNELSPVDSSAAGTARYLANGDFSNAGESLRKGAVEAGMDMLKAGAGVGDIFLPGTPLSDRLNRGLREDLGPDAAPYPQSTAGAGRGRVNPTAVQPGAAPAAAPAASAPPLNNSVIPGGAQAAGILRRGNSFTNTGSFVDDERSGGISAQNAAAATNLSNRSRAESLAASGLRGGLDSNLPAGAGATIPGVNAPASQYETELAARNASVRSMDADRGMNANQRALRDTAQAQLAETSRAHSMQDSTARRGQDVQAQTARAGQAVSLRGQDLTFSAATRGQDMTARTAATAARMEQMNKDRQFHFDVSKHGDDVAKQRFEMRQEAEKNVHSQIANMLPPTTDANGKQVPDTATAARYATGLNAIVAQRQEVLQQRASQGDRRAQEALDDLSRNGLAALDAKTVRDFVNGMKAKDLSDQYATGRLNPVGGTGTITDTPAAGLRKTSDGFFGFGGEYSLVDANGRPTGATVPARAVEGDGSFVGGKRRTDLRDFITQ